VVIWFIGISGAGKTTIGTRLHDYLCEKSIPNYLLDGDEVRAVFDGDLGYSREDREANIKRILLAAYALDRCGITTVVCNISPFEHLRALARRKIAGYNEIFLRKDLGVSRKNDVKGVYLTNQGKSKLIGVDIGFDEPLHPDLVLNVDNESVEESLQRVIEYVESRKTHELNLGD
jgi:adenylylsulfate kinase